MPTETAYQGLGKSGIGNNKNNEDLERLTRTGPKRLHVLYKYTLSKFNAYNMKMHTHAYMRMRAQAHLPVHTQFRSSGC